MALPDEHKLSVEEYLRLDRGNPTVRYEYFDGEVRMMAGGTEKHNLVCVNAITMLRNSLRGTSCRVYTSDMRVKVTQTRYVHPDVTVACNPKVSDEDILENPRLIIEVLSPSTANIDRGRKLSAYRRCSTVEEYAMINCDYKEVELFRRQEKDFWSFRSFYAGDSVTLSSLNLSMAVLALYEDVDVPDEMV
jgi:Uma2 family endonuclease